MFYGYAMNALNTKIRHFADELALVQTKGCQKAASEVLQHYIKTVEKHALMARVYEAYLNGRVEEQTFYTDALLETNIEADEFETTCITVIDFRRDIREIIEILKCNSNNLFHLIPSITKGLPFVHRSFRDFSDLALLDEKEILNLFQNVPEWLSPFMNALIAGINYEKGNFEYAVYFNQFAFEGLTKDTPPEISCSLKIMQAVLNDTEPSALHTSSFTRNIQTYKARKRFKQGDSVACEKWLAKNYTNPIKRILLDDIYTCLTTARALLLKGEPEQALLLLAKLRRLAVLYNRPLDIIETDILRVIAYNMNKNSKKALEAMSSALIIAQKYGFTTIFINEARDIYTTLNDLAFHITRSGETHGIDSVFLSHICNKTSKKLSKNFIHNLYNKQPSVKLTAKQVRLAEMLNKGYSYQEISKSLGVTHATAKSYLRELYNKLGAFNADEALDELYKLGILREGVF